MTDPDSAEWDEWEWIHYWAKEFVANDTNDNLFQLCVVVDMANEGETLASLLELALRRNVLKDATTLQPQHWNLLVKSVIYRNVDVSNLPTLATYIETQSKTQFGEAAADVEGGKGGGGGGDDGVPQPQPTGATGGGIVEAEGGLIGPMPAGIVDKFC